VNGQHPVFKKMEKQLSSMKYHGNNGLQNRMASGVHAAGRY